MKKDFIVRRSIYEIEGKPHIETYSEQELVRCGNCKYFSICDITSLCPETRPLGRCIIHNKVHALDWFCADGQL